MYICISIYVRMYGYMYIHVFICTCVRRLCVPLRAYEERIRICACKRVRIGCGWASRRFVARWTAAPLSLRETESTREREREKQTDRGREKERLRERTSPGGCVDTLGRAATPNSQAPPCGWRWHNHLAEIRDPCPRAACYKRLLDAPARLQRHGSAGKERINALTLHCSEIWRRTRCGR